MSIKPIDGGYLVDMRPKGRDGQRIRKKFKTKSQAQQYERYILATQHNNAWQDKPKDNRPFAELIELWWKLKGQTMKSGQGIKGKLTRIDSAMSHPLAYQVSKAAWANYRAIRFESGIKAKTLNREQEAMSSLFGSLIETGNFHHENPFRGMPQMRVHSSEMGFLTKDEITLLLDSLDGKEKLAAKLSLATGARWGEVLKLRRSHLANDRVMFINTKNSKNRTVPISAKLMRELSELGNNELLASADYALLRATIKNTAPGLPDGQAVHVLRHTFASHFMMNGGNILTLQKILGHSNIQQTMAYAHLAPDYLQDATRFNPLEN